MLLIFLLPIIISKLDVAPSIGQPLLNGNVDGNDFERIVLKFVNSFSVNWPLMFFGFAFLSAQGFSLL